MNRRERLIVGYLLLVVTVLTGFALLYNHGMAAWEGRAQPIYRSVQVTVQTVTTVGYGGDAPWESWQMNVLVSVMELSGLVLIFAALPVLVVPLFEDAFRSSVPTAAGGVSNHVVLCSYGPREEILIDELVERDIDYVLLNADRETATNLHAVGHRAIYGDPESDAALRRAGLERASALIADVDDETNPSILLSAQEVNPAVETVSLVEDPALADYQRYAGADHVFTPRQLLGDLLAERAAGSLDPDAVEAVEVDGALEVAEFSLQSGSELIGRTVADSGVPERTGATVIGAWFRGEFHSPPPPDARLTARSILVATGGPEQLDRLKELTLATGRRGRGTVVVVGMGVVGQAVADGLAAAGVDHTTVDIANRPTVDVVGDATEERVLREAGVADASTVVFALPADTTAVFATFVVRRLNPAAEIIVRANDRDSVPKLYRAGADYVLSLAGVSGRMFASVVLGEEFLDGDTQLELVWTTAGGVAGRSLADADVRARTGCTVVAVERNGAVFTEAGPGFVVETGDELIVAGTVDSVRRFHEQFG